MRMPESKPSWYYSVAGQQFGPVSGTELKRHAETGKITESDLVWKDGMAEWVPAKKVKGLLPVATPHAPPRQPPSTDPPKIPDVTKNRFVVVTDTTKPVGKPNVSRHQLKQASDFSFSGRIGRDTFWGTRIAIIVIGFVVGLLIEVVSKIGDAGPVVGLVIYVLFSIAAVWIGLATQVKRWHDLGYSGWVVLLSIIPIVNLLYALVAIVCLPFLKGTKGQNRYGDDPLEP
jgi:uncharacterized membrane protein YhaH (DUF805 family)